MDEWGFKDAATAEAFHRAQQRQTESRRRSLTRQRLQVRRELSSDELHDLTRSITHVATHHV
jgi:hypothetical protein